MKIFGTIKEGLVLTFFSPVKLIKLHVPFFATLLVWMAVFMACPFNYQKEEEIVRMIEEFPLVFALDILLVFVMIFLSIGFFVRVIRLPILGYEGARPKDFFAKGCTFFFCSIGIGFLAALPIFILLIISSLTPFNNIMAMGIGIIAAVYIHVRLYLYIPARISDRRLSLKEAWTLTYGYFWKIMATIISSIGIIFLLMFALLLLSSFIAGLLAKMISIPLMFGVVILLYMFVYAFYYMLPALVYRNIYNDIEDKFEKVVAVEKALDDAGIKVP